MEEVSGVTLSEGADKRVLHLYHCISYSTTPHFINILSEQTPQKVKITIDDQLAKKLMFHRRQRRVNTPDSVWRYVPYLVKSNCHTIPNSKYVSSTGNYSEDINVKPIYSSRVIFIAEMLVIMALRCLALSFFPGKLADGVLYILSEFTVSCRAAVHYYYNYA